jgi:hypothetical protein
VTSGVPRGLVDTPFEENTPPGATPAVAAPAGRDGHA